VTREEALEWIAGLFEEPVEGIQPDTAREAIPRWDSLGTLMLMVGLDEKLDIQVDADEVSSMKRVDDILTVLRRHGKLS
jgi:acyl carrier protein